MSININILPQGTLAIYEQIIMQLKNAIVTGELKSGEALPSIRALATDLQVSVIMRVPVDLSEFAPIDL